MNIAFVTSEFSPFASTGGLGEVSGALPMALTRQGHDVIVILPLYGSVYRHGVEMEDTGLRLDIPVGLQSHCAEIYKAVEQGVTIYFVERDEYFDRRELYSLKHRDYEDNFERFVFFQKASVDLLDRLAFNADIVHGNDWQCGLVPSFLRHGIHGVGRAQREKTVFTIHNLAYQGIFPASEFARTNLPYSSFSVQGMEFYGQVSCMKAGIVSADRITTVSEKYAQEIQTETLGYGLNGVLTDRRNQLSGIVNGIDNDKWNPETDPELPMHYSSETLREGKAGCKRALGQAMGLALKEDTLLIGMVTRLVELKGINLLADCIRELMKRNVALVMLGTGREIYHEAAKAWAMEWPGQFACDLRYDAGVAHRIYGGADVFLMPSEVEPCGLSQLYSMRYGTLPIVHATGGLDDTVENLDAQGKVGNGFKFVSQTPKDLLDAVDRALALFAKPAKFLAAQRRAMGIDHSWDLSARKYVALYQSLLDQS